MKKDELYSKLIGNSIPTYYKWLKQRKENNGINNNRLILKLLDDYFTHDELVEYLTTHTIKKFDRYKYLLEMETNTLLPQAKKTLQQSGELSVALDTLNVLIKLKERYNLLIEEYKNTEGSKFEGKFDEIGDHEIDKDEYLSMAYTHKEFNTYIVDIIFNNTLLFEQYLSKKLSAFAIYQLQNTIISISKNHLEEVILNHYESIYDDFALSLKRLEEVGSPVEKNPTYNNDFEGEKNVHHIDDKFNL